jgi:hypothetical protein
VLAGERLRDTLLKECLGDSSLAPDSTRTIDERHQVELFGNPRERADVPDGSRAHRIRLAQLGQRWAIRWAEHNLAADRTTRRGIPHGLRGDPVPAARDRPLEEVHTFFI